MDYLLLGYVIIPVCSILFIPIIRTYFTNIDNRIKNMEQQMQLKVTEAETRQIISDKLDPVKESLDEIKQKINQLTNYLLHKED